MMDKLLFGITFSFVIFIRMMGLFLLIIGLLGLNNCLRAMLGLNNDVHTKRKYIGCILICTIFISIGSVIMIF